MSEIITETAAPKKRMLSGIKPSGDLTLGSYLGAVKNWAERADQFDCFYFMADLHAITPAESRRPAAPYPGAAGAVYRLRPGP